VVADRCDAVAARCDRSIAPTNNALQALDPAKAGADSRRLIEKWGTLHAGRTALGILSALLFF